MEYYVEKQFLHGLIIVAMEEVDMQDVSLLQKF